MTRTLTTERLKALLDELKSWQYGYDPVDDKEQFDMLATAEWAVIELLANREAQPVLYASEETLAYAKEGEKSLVTWSDPMGDAVIPLYTAQPAPAVVKLPTEFYSNEGIVVRLEQVMAALAVVGVKYERKANAKTRCECSASEVPEEMTGGIAMSKYKVKKSNYAQWVKGWNACRAAMLAQPVSSGYTLNSPEIPDGWIACSEQMPEVGERDWRTALPVLVKCEIGVIPAYYGFTYHEGEQCFGFMESVKFGDASGSGPEQHENRLMMHVTHWMPLPAAPEVSRDDA